MSPSTAEAIRERNARAAKAQAIAAVLVPMIDPLMAAALMAAALPGRGEHQARLVTRMLRDLSLDARVTAAVQAHQRPPSPTTWALVVGLVANHYEFEAA